MINDINEVIQKGVMSRYQKVAITICLAINMLDGFDVLVMAFTASSVASEWQLQGSDLGILFSAGLLGMSFGSLFVAPLADKFGRRVVVLTCLVIISVGMFLSALSQSMMQLVSLRLMTGLGIGGLLASLNVIVAEYSSLKWRDFAVSFLQTGYPIGAVIGGSIAVFLIGEYGWRSVFLFGAIASTLLIPLAFLNLPESLAFLLARRPANALIKVNALLRHMGHQEINELPPLSEDGVVPPSGIRDLVSGDLRRSSLLIWLAFFMVMLSFYFVLSWTPKLLVEAGLSAGEGISAGVLLNVGGIVGGLILGYLSTRLPLRFLIGTYMIVTAISMVLFSVYASNMSTALGLCVLIGFFLFGSMIGLYALVPSLYPVSIRTTGMGWAIGVGRGGAVLSPLAAGILLDNQWQSTTLFLIFAIPLVISMVAVSAIRKS